jgi:hypothetical protein
MRYLPFGARPSHEEFLDGFLITSVVIASAKRVTCTNGGNRVHRFVDGLLMRPWGTVPAPRLGSWLLALRCAADDRRSILDLDLDLDLGRRPGRLDEGRWHARSRCLRSADIDALA